MTETLTATITCPECGTPTEAEMPTDACVFFWDCPACAAVIRPKAGDCCVFCSYADRPCPPIAGSSCCS
ncbi:GDCCVxC domain-containing (seleno)protein [Rubrivirga sp. IMCC43871]|uniref:GDCCVxC domain-containing (seleno)protein n=1 Tax=Rubrivirga sp. IMCC43871 TaxID=3391575 RepID=UPI00398FE102